jgi:DNA-binding NarL/FixJ family response regulator
LVLFESWVNAALRGGDWIVPLTRSATLLEARAAVLVLSESGRTVLDASPDAPPEFIRLCSELAKVRATGFFERDDAELGRIAWTNVKPEGAGDVMFAALFAGPVDQELFRDISAFAATNVATKARFASMRATSALKTAALETLPFGVVIVDCDLRVVESNEACRQILSRADGINVVCHRLHCREAVDQRALHKAIDRALGGDAAASVVKVRRNRGAQPYVVRVVTQRANVNGGKRCLLMIVNPDEAPTPCGDIWRAMFGLTDCELIIAEGIVNGQRINDIAHQRGVSVETVRTQTKRMFERLNVSSQAEAAARLSRTAPFRLTSAEHRWAQEVA